MLVRYYQWQPDLMSYCHIPVTFCEDVDGCHGDLVDLSLDEHNHFLFCQDADDGDDVDGSGYDLPSHGMEQIHQSSL